MSVTATRIYLNTSSTTLADAVDLMNVGSDRGCFVMLGGLTIAPGKPNQWRPITLELFIRGAGPNDLQDERRAIQRMLRLAGRATGDPLGYWSGSPVVLWANELGSSNFVYFDVAAGEFTAKKRDFGPVPCQQWTLTLSCYPAALGTPYLTTKTAALTNGLNGYVFIDDVPGDVPALCQPIVDDVFTSGALNAIRFGRRGLDGVRSSTPFYTPVIKTSVAGSAISVADTSALDGAHTPQITLTTAWQSVGVATGGTGSLDNGIADIVAHIKSSQTLLQPPYNIQSTVTYGGGGTVPIGVYQIVITALDGSGNETVGSDPLYVNVTAASATIALTWTDQGTASNHRVYVIQGIAAFDKYVATGSGTSSYSMTALPSTGGGPPAVTAPALVPPEVRVRVAIAAPSPSWSPPGDPYQLVWGGEWEYAYGGRFPTPPLPQQEGANYQGFMVLLEARNTGTATGITLSCDGFWLMPANEPQQIVEWPLAANTTQYRYVLDTRRDGQASCLLESLADSSNQGQLVPRGAFMLHPGGNCVPFMLTGPQGKADVQAAQIKLQFRITPRYLDTIGTVS